jgi:signal transduction histidine kinase
MSTSSTQLEPDQPELASPELKISFIIPLVGFVLLFGVIAATGFLALRQASEQAAIERSLDVQRRLSRILTLLLDAETGERGYVLTGEENYLEPFYSAAPRIEAEIKRLRAATGDNEAHQRQAAALLQLARDKLTELRQMVELRRSQGIDAAVARIQSGQGKEAMDRARALIAQMAGDEARILRDRQTAALNSDRAVQIGIVAAVLLLLGLIAAALREVRRQFRNVSEARAFMENANWRLKEEGLQRERLGMQLREAQKMEAIGQLSGGLAHDFNNMLAVITGSLALIKRRIGRGDTNVAQLIEGGLDGAQRAANLTSRLLAVARQQPLAPEPVDVNKFVAKMSDLLKHTLGEHVRLESVLGGGIWRTYIDSSQLENAILNLCVNARDAMPQGGRLTIETANASLDDAYAAEHGVPAGQYVLVAVSDTGSGMSPETVQNAFDPFFTTKSGKGTGLGLSQVYGFARQSGGHAKIYSEPGHGTTVKLYLPRHMRDTHEAPVLGQPRDLQQLRGQPGETILVVEDDEQVRSVALRNIEELGYGTLEAQNAAAALRVLDAHPEIVLLFTDIVMPDMNGRALADEATRRRPALKVLFTTGFTRNAVVHNGVVDAGVNFIAKPFSIEALATKIRMALDG